VLDSVARFLRNGVFILINDNWPFASTEDDINAELMNTVSKLVFSRTLSQAEWGKWGTIRLVKDDPAEVIAHLKQQPGKDMVIFGSGGLVSQLAQAGLVDDYQLRVHPVVLGSGKPPNARSYNQQPYDKNTFEEKQNEQ